MRSSIFFIALAISDVAKNDLSGEMPVVVGLFIMFLTMDLFELFSRR